MDLYRSLLKTDRFFVVTLSFYFSFIYKSIMQRSYLRNKFILFLLIKLVRLTLPLGTDLRVPPQDPTLGFHLRVLAKGPGSWVPPKSPGFWLPPQSLGFHFSGMPVSSYIKKRVQHRCFSVNIAKFSKTVILIEICKRLLLNNVMRSYSSMKTVKQVWKSMTILCYNLFDTTIYCYDELIRCGDKLSGCSDKLIWCAMSYLRLQ